MSEPFEEYVQKAMDEVVRNHQHSHSLFRETSVSSRVIDAENRRAAFVLMEQIDTDRLTHEGVGILGDQFRYSVWYLMEGSEPMQIYEDHDYIRKSKNAMTGTMGRDSTINLCGILTDGVLIETTPKDAEGGMYSKVKIKVGFDGVASEPDDFMEQAKNLVKRIAPKLGYDYVRGSVRLEGRNVAAITYGTENGSTYGYDTQYLVWKAADGKLRYRELLRTEDYNCVIGIKEEGNQIVIETGKSKCRVDAKSIGLE